MDPTLNSNTKAAVFWIMMVCIAVLLWATVRTQSATDPGEVSPPLESTWNALFVNALPFVLLLAFWIFMMRQMNGFGGIRGGSCLDKLLTQSATRAVKARKPIPIRLHTTNEGALDVELIWADSRFLKYRTQGGQEAIVSKDSVKKIEQR